MYDCQFPFVSIIIPVKDEELVLPLCLKAIFYALGKYQGQGEVILVDNGSSDNTVKIAERCNLTLNFENIFLPHFEISEEETHDEHLRKKAGSGLEKLMPVILEGQNGNLRDEYEKRLNGELEIIKSMGFAGYFLICWDFVNFARKNDIPVGPGRGSGAGQKIASFHGNVSCAR